ncbi:hypothetical protein HY604_05355 [Candidatus Peregrinibacteria bacterium]|nr:hypothetical protein [Candidatus Peregrinibacteria bacterium]
MKKDLFSPSRLVWQRRIDEWQGDMSEGQANIDGMKKNDPTHELFRRKEVLSARILRKVEQLNASGDKLEAGKLMHLFDLLSGYSESREFLNVDGSLRHLANWIVAVFRKENIGFGDLRCVYHILSVQNSRDRLSQLKRIKEVIMKVLDTSGPLSEVQKVELRGEIYQLVMSKKMKNTILKISALSQPLSELQKNELKKDLDEIEGAILNVSNSLDAETAKTSLSKLMGDDFPIEGEIDLYKFVGADFFMQQSVLLGLIEKMIQ